MADIRVRLVSITAHQLIDKQLTLPEGARLSELLEEFVPDQTANLKVGIYGQFIAQPSQRVLQDGDRVELYQPVKRTKINRRK